MHTQANATPTSGSTLSGLSIIGALKRTGVEFILSVPDICTSAGLLMPISSDPALHLVRLCKEDEGVSICASLSFCDRRAVLLMQQTGLMDSLNALRAIGVDYHNPVCMMVGLLGKEPDLAPAQSRSFGVRVITPILDVMGIRYCVLNSDADIEAGMQAIDDAYRLSEPVAILLGRNPS
jgi:sulfopyruvate decarboxylase subunit alpha